MRGRSIWLPWNILLQRVSVCIGKTPRHLCPSWDLAYQATQTRLTLNRKTSSAPTESPYTDRELELRSQARRANKLVELKFIKLGLKVTGKKSTAWGQNWIATKLYQILPRKPTFSDDEKREQRERYQKRLNTYLQNRAEEDKLRLGRLGGYMFLTREQRNLSMKEAKQTITRYTAERSFSDYNGGIQLLDQQTSSVRAIQHLL